ncbi:MAG: hypothetical protein ACLQIB_19650 [Isosphaeraceae bacterium]
MDKAFRIAKPMRKALSIFMLLSTKRDNTVQQADDGKKEAGRRDAGFPEENFLEIVLADVHGGLTTTRGR